MSPAEIETRLRAAGCVFAEEEARLLADAAKTPAELAGMVERRAVGLPLEYIIGWAGFRGLRISVEPGVFVPRRRTEFLVGRAAALARARAGERPVVVDLCCGSGAVGAALAVELGPVELHAADVDLVAVRCARRNIAAAGGRAYAGDLYDPLPVTLRGCVDILAANVPYVPTGDIALMPPEAREHEPREALDGGPDGLSVLRRVTSRARDWLSPAGFLLIETSDRQVADALAAFTAGGLHAHVETDPELAATVVVGLVSR